MSESYTAETAKLIEQGRSLQGVPYSQKHLSFKNFAELFEKQVSDHPQKNFLTSLNKEGEIYHYTYAEFYAKSCQIANLLIIEFNVLVNERVSSVAYNHSDTVALMFACWMVGACYVPINAGEDDDRITFILNNSHVHILFVMPEYKERITSLKISLKTVTNFVQLNDSAITSFENLSDLLAGMSSEFNALDRATLETEALLVYTSGTTGTPKGVVLQQYNCLVNAQEIAKWYGFDSLDKVMLVLPIHHVNGIIVTLLTPLYFGGSVVLNEKFSATNYWKIANEYGCTYGSVVPTILSFLCEIDKQTFKKPANNFFVICGAGPLTVQSAKRFNEKFDVKVNHGYGLSETTCYSSYLPHTLSEQEYKKWMYDYGYPSIGMAMPCNEMDIHNEQGKMVLEGEKGEIVIRGHNVMFCYDKRPDANAEAFEFGWFKSGDEGFYKFDKEGHKFFFITGRLKELIIRGGVNYSPLEIDEVINHIDGVKTGMAVGFENNMYGEEIGAYVVLEEESTLKEDDIIKQCESLPFSKRPKVVVIGKVLPVTSTGKYQRHKLKPLFLEWVDAQFRE